MAFLGHRQSKASREARKASSAASGCFPLFSSCSTARSESLVVVARLPGEQGGAEATPSVPPRSQNRRAVRDAALLRAVAQGPRRAAASVRASCFLLGFLRLAPSPSDRGPAGFVAPPSRSRAARRLWISCGRLHCLVEAIHVGGANCKQACMRRRKCESCSAEAPNTAPSARGRTLTAAHLGEDEKSYEN